MDSSISSDLIRGHIDTIILKTLISGDKCAFDITKDIEERSNGEYLLKQATLYSALKRLETLKMIDPYWSDSPEGGRRRYFKLTDEGKKLIEESLNEWSYSKNILDLLITDGVSEKKTEVKVVYKESPAPIVEETAATEYEEPVNYTAYRPSDYVRTESVKEEVNFRQVLNDILKSSNSVEVIKDEAEDEKINKTSENKEKVSIEDVKISYTGYDKVDYSDIVEKSLQEGFSVKFANRKKKKAGFYVNKINIISAFITFFVMILEILTVSLIGFVKPLSAWLMVLVPVAFLSAVFFLCYSDLPKTSEKNFKSQMWTSLVIAINLSLLTVAIALLTNVDFADKHSVAFVLVPCLLYFDAFIYFAVKNLLVFGKRFAVNA